MDYEVARYRIIFTVRDKSEPNELRTHQAVRYTEEEALAFARQCSKNVGFHDVRIEQVRNMIFELKESAKKYVYGMRLRGFSIGCQPMAGFIERRDSKFNDFYDVIVYSRLLTQDELDDYDLTFIGTEEVQ